MAVYKAFVIVSFLAAVMSGSGAAQALSRNAAIDEGLVSGSKTISGRVSGSSPAVFKFKVTRPGCYRIENSGRSGGPSLQLELRDRNFETEQRFLAYDPSAGTSPGRTVEMLAETYFLVVRYLGSPKGIFRISIDRTQC